MMKRMVMMVMMGNILNVRRALVWSYRGSPWLKDFSNQTEQRSEPWEIKVQLTAKAHRVKLLWALKTSLIQLSGEQELQLLSCSERLILELATPGDGGPVCPGVWCVLRLSRGHAAAAGARWIIFWFSLWCGLFFPSGLIPGKCNCVLSVTVLRKGWVNDSRANKKTQSENCSRAHAGLKTEGWVGLFCIKTCSHLGRYWGFYPLSIHFKVLLILNMNCLWECCNMSKKQHKKTLLFIYVSVISSLNIKSYNHLLVIPLFSFNNVL